jgi:polysaccharide export outer membrane protein
MSCLHRPLRSISLICASAAVAIGVGVPPAQGQTAGARASLAPAASADTARPAVVPSSDYVIGPEDQLSVVFFQNRDMSADVVVRPDGKISLPLLNDIQASGLTPEQLRQFVSTQAKRFIQEPNATVVVRQINSRKVSIIGSVEKPGTYPLVGPTTVLQLIGNAAGLKEYADSRKIVIVRTEQGRQQNYAFNYKDVIAQKNIAQNIELKPGDTVIVP